MTVEQLKRCNVVMNDCWKLLAKFGKKIEDMHESDEFMEELFEDAKLIKEKHGYDQFVKAQILAVVNEIDRQVREIEAIKRKAKKT